MNLASRAHRGRVLAFCALGLIALSALLVGLWRPWAPLPEAAPIGAGDEPIVVEPAPLVLPEHPLVLVFGDSWTYGSAAAPYTQGYAYQLGGMLGGESVVKGVRGSGYLKPGLDGPAFGARIAALNPGIDPDLVIIQGSINDRLQGATGYREAVNAAWDALSALYPDAPIVVLGPAPHELPVGEGTARIDVDLAELAAARGWWYISPIERDWITPDNYLDIIDVEVGRKHPSTEGHRYLAEKVATALAEFGGEAATEPVGSETGPEQ
ncbi:SGNH/GDSL hydrolase family protein [Microbacterium sp. CIAB417]|uniref:SGNH/GDSL hydrolase family protein n=1 Tax=Microbacterium sp. CIAB417 TaxID=2860287 RepID=UPI001FAD9E01|nr:SGNH/GDSL hydrolase family protein [Microbacterium sp. CIAB417]